MKIKIEAVLEFEPFNFTRIQRIIKDISGCNVNELVTDGKINGSFMHEIAPNRFISISGSAELSNEIERMEMIVYKIKDNRYEKEN